MAAETPCSVLYNDIRSFGGLKHLEIARMLINGNSYLGSTLLEKCSSNRSYLTRYIVHRKPDQCAPAIYSDFTVTTLNLSAAICSKLGGGESAYQAIAEHYRGPAANEMMSALASYKLDSRLYANALNRIDNFDGNAVREKKHALLDALCGNGGARRSRSGRGHRRALLRQQDRRALWHHRNYRRTWLYEQPGAATHRRP